MSFAAELGRLIIDARIERMKQHAEAATQEEGQTLADLTDQKSKFLMEGDCAETTKKEPAPHQ